MKALALLVALIVTPLTIGDELHFAPPGEVSIVVCETNGHALPGFNMPVGVTLSANGFTVVHPTEAWQTARLELANPADFAADANYYVIARCRDFSIR